MQREHPIKIMKLMSKNFWLLFIPLIRGLISLRGDFYAWIRGAWLDILVVLIIFGSAYLRWLCSYYQVKGDHVISCTGVFLKRQFTIPFTALCAASAERPFLMRPVMAVNLYFDTNTGFTQNADMSLTVGTEEYRTLFNSIGKEKENTFKTSYLPSAFNLIFFSFAFSSTLSGVIFISTLIYQSTKIIGRSLETTLMDTAQELSQRLILKLPPLAIALSILLLSGWFVSFIKNFLRYVCFKIERNGKNIFIRSGLFTKRHYYINTDNVNYTDIRQNLLMKIFRVMSVHVNCAGYGKKKNEIPVFVPITTKNQVMKSLKLLLPSMIPQKITVKPSIISIFSYIWQPVILCIVIPVGSLITAYFLPEWKEMLWFLCFMLLIPSIWLLVVNFIAIFTTGIGADKKNITISYCSGYFFHTIVIPRDKIAKVAISQNILQTQMENGRLKIYSTNEFIQSHTLWSIPLQGTIKFLKDNGLLVNDIEFFESKSFKKILAGTSDEM